MDGGRTRARAVVIGAGQAGLSVAFHLVRAGLTPGDDLLLLDRGPDAGGAWQHRWEALRIGDAHRIDDLPGMRAMDLSFRDADTTRPARSVVADVYRRFEEFYDLEVIRPAIVTSVQTVDPLAETGDLLVTVHADDGSPREIVTEVVVNASGTWGSSFSPWYPGLGDFRGRSVHTSDYRAAADFTGERVIVVGGGTSAVGFLLELEPVAAALTWVTRHPVRFLDQAGGNLEGRVAAVAAQDAAARAGLPLPSIVSGTGIPKTRAIAAGIDRGLLVPRPMFTRLEETGARFADGSLLRADAIIWATGFRPELRHLAPLQLRERTGGIRVVDGRSQKDPRIFFAGYGPGASTIGANRAGRMIARGVMAALSGQ